jgi:hypothetical protein
VAASLPRLASAFAGKITHLLNTTICTGVRIAAVISTDPNVILVGHGLTRSSLVPEPFPVQIGQKKPVCWLDVGYRLCLDEEASAAPRKSLRGSRRYSGGWPVSAR